MPDHSYLTRTAPIVTAVTYRPQPLYDEEADGLIYTHYVASDGHTSGNIARPMFEVLHDPYDECGQWRWSPGPPIDEHAWLRNGTIQHRREDRLWPRPTRQR